MERDIENPPPKECNKSALVTVDSQYFWTILSPHPNSIECVFIGSNTRVVQRDCEQQKEPKDPSKKGLTISHCHWNGKQKPQVEEGMVVRVSIPEQDGHFSSVQYLAQMSEYNDEHNKALLDIVRYACAHAFLKVPIPRINPSQVELDEILRPFTVHNMGLLDSIGAISAGLGSIADAWSKLSNAFGSRVTETVRRRICLGFSRYEHTVTGSVARSIPLKLFGEVVDALIKVAKVKNKDVDELREIMIILELTDDMTWKGQTSSYTSSDGFHRFFHFYKYVNQTTNTVDIVFGNLAADFTIAPDTLIIDKNKVSWGGLSREQTTVFRDVPHVITMDDAALLNTYFEVVAYRHIAAVLREPVPPYPSLGGACSEV
ncbi:hypothetical protein BGZ73_008916 [Actinomortierella ambigua]|nr:hypothetical protein BGZ73_008916 [Actinomortierella ambigua]